MLMIIVIAYIIVWCTKYVAQVYEIHEEDFCVMHLHKSDKAGTVFIAKDVTDKYGVEVQEQVCRLLPSPVMDNRERYHFAEAVPEAE